MGAERFSNHLSPGDSNHILGPYHKLSVNTGSTCIRGDGRVALSSHELLSRRLEVGNPDDSIL